MLKYRLTISTMLALCAVTFSAEAHTHLHGPETHAHMHTIPIGLMGAHQHPVGEWMFSLQFMGSGLAGYLDQRAPVSEQTVLDGHEMSARDMNMLMPMLGLMYAPADWLTLMAMVPGMWMQMSHVGHEAHLHTQQATAISPQIMTHSGLGDISLTALIGNWRYQHHTLHLNLGLSLPTGTLDSGETYAMRPGSGSWDLLPGLSYAGSAGDWSWGLMPGGVIRLGLNSRGYQLGHRLNGSGWLAYRWHETLSSSVRLQGQLWGAVSGRDSRLEPGSIPGNDPAQTAGQRLDLLMGLNYQPWPGQQFGVEAGLPVYQNLSGPQLATRWLLNAGWQGRF